MNRSPPPGFEHGALAVQRPHTCRNCGVLGHLYKECPHPTMSFGVICFREHAGQLQYLMIQRKDSLSFMEFVRGKYLPTQVEYIRQLLSCMTHTERNLLLTEPFESLWNYVWYQPSIPRPSAEFIEAKRKFDQIKSGFLHERVWVNLQDLITRSPSSYDEPEWGFPKGRRKLREDDADCAVREFCEETGLHAGDLEIVQGLPPFEEIFYGTNNVLYRHVYYVARFRGAATQAEIPVDRNNINQIREVRAIRWFSLPDTLEHIRAHNRERRDLIVRAHASIVGAFKA
jgi:8-oxo-dGTP pyrophosphatase MutT (NUDIX family)